MDVFKTHGAFSWSELMTTDPAAASEFYGGLFGWQIKKMDNPAMDYRVANVGEAAIGGIMAMPPGAPGMRPQWGVYVTVTDLDATLAKAKALGGQVCMPAMDVPGVGRMAAVADPQGAVVNLMQYSG